MGSLKALENWCRIKCEHYPNVKIRNMSSSFRDGLAFCAIIHKHRPDLIDFYSLSKDNIYENNRLAFEVAESRLGIPALLDPGDMVSLEMPDRLGVITYLSQYYFFFNRISHASPASLKVSHVGVADPSLLKRHLSSPPALETATSSAGGQTGTDRRAGGQTGTDRRAGGQTGTDRRAGGQTGTDRRAGGQTGTDRRAGGQTGTDRRAGGQTGTDRRAGPAESRSSRGTPTSVCASCRKHVHLVQRHLVEGKLYHRTCLRCRLCSTALLPGTFRERRETDSLGCAHHRAANQNARPGLSRQAEVGPTEHLPKLGGQEVTSPQRGHAPGLDPSVSFSHCTGRTESTRPPQLATEERLLTGAQLRSPGTHAGPQEETETKKTDPCGLTPAPAGHSAPQEGVCRPVPAPRRISDPSVPPRPAPRTRAAMDSPSATGKSADLRKSSPSSAGGSHKPKDPPWMSIVHPGPWNRLPPAPAPTKPSRSASLSSLHGTGEWFWKKLPPANPFGEEDEEEGDDASNEGSTGRPNPDRADGEVKLANAPENATSAQPDQTCPESVSEPAIFSAGLSPRPPVLSTNGGAAGPAVSDTEAAPTLSHSKQACKENPFDREAPPLGIPTSETFQGTAAARVATPGHGFPLVRRKVQADQVIPAGELQGERGELDRQMDSLETRGVELERSLRDCQNNQEEDGMLVDWFTLIQEKQKLVRRDTELVYLTKQQHFEERQADVEYQLRCLLNRPESEWSKDDRGRERRLMDELVTVIEQRDQIINGLEQDRQREKEEDMLLEAMVQRKDFRKEGEKDLKKSKGKLNPLSVLKMLGHKTENTKDPKSKGSQKKKS